MLKKSIKLNMNGVPYLPPKEIIEAFSSFYLHLPRASLFAALAALQNPAYMRRKNVDRVNAEKERLWKMLNEFAMHGYPSTTNFFLAKTEITDFVRGLDDMGIQILDLSDQLAPGFIRVSTGTRDENDAFIKGCTKICGTKKK
jgi:histidinol-phosphate/aromatic aminotransferase/cobyric acid decarboxylase-like protein